MNRAIACKPTPCIEGGVESRALRGRRLEGTEGVGRAGRLRRWKEAKSGLLFN
jgi:hypothetical protein